MYALSRSHTKRVYFVQQKYVSYLPCKYKCKHAKVQQGDPWNRKWICVLMLRKTLCELWKNENFVRNSQFPIQCSFSFDCLRHSWHTYKNQNMHVNDLYGMQWVVLRVAFSIILSRMWTSNFIPITRKSLLVVWVKIRQKRMCECKRYKRGLEMWFKFQIFAKK